MRLVALMLAAVCGLAACGGGSSKPDPNQAAKLRPLTSDEAAPRVKAGRLATMAPALNRICADNARRAARAQRLGADSDAVAKAAAERLSGLVAKVPRPTDADARYTAWTDSLKTVANLRRLAVDAGGDKAKALRKQAELSTSASHKTAARLGLTDCAK